MLTLANKLQINMKKGLFFTLLFLIICHFLPRNVYGKDGNVEFDSLVSKFNLAKDGERFQLAFDIFDFTLKMPYNPYSQIADKNSREKIIAFLTCFQIIETLEIKGFDFSNPPSIHVLPPKNAGINAGTDPVHVKDPVLREEYKASIAKNNARAEVFLNQYLIREKKAFLLHCMKEFLINHQNTETKRMLLRILEDSKLDKGTKDSIFGDFSLKSQLSP